MSAVGADVVFVGTILASLGGDALQFLLRRSVGVPNLNQEILLTDRDAVKVVDDLLADIAALKALVACVSSNVTNDCRKENSILPCKADATAIAHAVTEDLGRHNVERLKDRGEHLRRVSLKSRYRFK